MTQCVVKEHLIQEVVFPLSPRRLGKGPGSRAPLHAARPRPALVAPEVVRLAVGILEALLAEPLGKFGLSVVAELEPARVGDRKRTEYDPSVCVLAFTIFYAPVDPKTKIRFRFLFKHVTVFIRIVDLV